MQIQPLLTQKAELVKAQQSERQTQKIAFEKRLLSEQQQRQSQYQKGFKGLWMLVTGRYHKQKQQHEEQHQASLERDKQEKQHLVQRQTKKRQVQQKRLNKLSSHQQKERMQLNRDLMTHYKGITPQGELKNTFSYQHGIEQQKPSQQPDMGM